MSLSALMDRIDAEEALKKDKPKSLRERMDEIDAQDSQGDSLLKTIGKSMKAGMADPLETAYKGAAALGSGAVGGMANLMEFVGKSAKDEALNPSDRLAKRGIPQEAIEFGGVPAEVFDEKPTKKKSPTEYLKDIGYEGGHPEKINKLALDAAGYKESKNPVSRAAVQAGQLLGDLTAGKAIGLAGKGIEAASKAAHKLPRFAKVLKSIAEGTKDINKLSPQNIGGVLGATIAPTAVSDDNPWGQLGAGIVGSLVGSVGAATLGKSAKKNLLDTFLKDKVETLGKNEKIQLFENLGIPYNIADVTESQATKMLVATLEQSVLGHPLQKTTKKQFEKIRSILGVGAEGFKSDAAGELARSGFKKSETAIKKQLAEKESLFNEKIGALGKNIELNSTNTFLKGKEGQFSNPRAKQGFKSHPAVKIVDQFTGNEVSQQLTGETGQLYNKLIQIPEAERTVANKQLIKGLEDMAGKSKKTLNFADFDQLQKEVGALTKTSPFVSGDADTGLTRKIYGSVQKDLISAIEGDYTKAYGKEAFNKLLDYKKEAARHFSHNKDVFKKMQELAESPEHYGGLFEKAYASVFSKKKDAGKAVKLVTDKFTKDEKTEWISHVSKKMGYSKAQGAEGKFSVNQWAKNYSALDATQKKMLYIDPKVIHTFDKVAKVIGEIGKTKSEFNTSKTAIHQMIHAMVLGAPAAVSALVYSKDKEDPYKGLTSFLMFPLAYLAGKGASNKRIINAIAKSPNQSPKIPSSMARAIAAQKEKKEEN